MANKLVLSASGSKTRQTKLENLERKKLHKKLGQLLLIQKDTAPANERFSAKRRPTWSKQMLHLGLLPYLDILKS